MDHTLDTVLKQANTPVKKGFTMNDKLILRAASRYRKWMVSQEYQQNIDVKSHALDALWKTSIKAEQIKEWAERFFSGTTPRFQRSRWDKKNHEGIMSPEAYAQIAKTMIPDLGSDIISDIQFAVAAIKKTTKKMVTPLSPREAVEEIRVITQAWPDTEYRRNILSVKIKDITLKDDDEEVFLGSFWIHVNLSHPLDSLEIKSIDCIASENGDYFHPHVSGSELCIGEGNLTSKEALCQGRLEDYFRIVEAVLRTYNSNSPHEKLEQWYNPDHDGEFFCDSCAEWRSDDSGCYCVGCENIYCEYCDNGGGGCAKCDEWYCGECLVMCHDCKDAICHHCSTACLGCEHTHCSSCLNECRVCVDQHCSLCLDSCHHCGDPVCESCMNTCGCCEKNCCDACVIDERCEICKNDICQECQTSCSQCNKVICETCEDNVCEHCGVPMCEICLDKHNCLLAEISNKKP